MLIKSDVAGIVEIYRMKNFWDEDVSAIIFLTSYGSQSCVENFIFEVRERDFILTNKNSWDFVSNTLYSKENRKKGMIGQFMIHNYFEL